MKKLKAKGKAGKAKVEAELEERKRAQEAKYREGIMQDDTATDVKWAPLEGWVAHEQSEAKPKSALALKAEAKAKKSLLGKVHKGVTKKMMTMCTEISSDIMTACEEPTRAKDQELGVIVNSLSAISNTYNLGQNSKKRWPYLRRFASDKMTQQTVSMLESSADPATKIVEMKAEIGAIISTKKADAAKMVEAKVKDIMSGEVEGNVPEGVPGEVAAEAVAEGKKDLQELLDSIGSQATVIAISKVDTSTQVMIDAVSGLLDRLLASYDEVKEKGGVDGNGNLNEEAVEEMQEIVYGHVEAEYATVLEKVSKQVGGFVHILGGLMGGEEDEE